MSSQDKGLSWQSWHLGFKDIHCPDGSHLMPFNNHQLKEWWLNLWVVENVAVGFIALATLSVPFRKTVADCWQ